MKIFAHRGAMGQAPENTMESFRKAIEAGADGIELDVQLSRDCQLVVIHDETINRVSAKTDQPPLYVKDLTFEELACFDVSAALPGTSLGEIKGVSRSTARIPALEEVLELIYPTGMKVNIELKTDIIPYDGIEEKTAELVRRFDMEERVIYSSFNHFSVLRMKKLAPESETAFLLMQKIADAGEYVKKYGVGAIHPDFRTFTGSPGMAEQCRNLGVGIRVWGIRDEDVPYCREQEVEAIFTNDPERYKDRRL